MAGPGGGVYVFNTWYLNLQNELTLLELAVKAHHET